MANEIQDYKKLLSQVRQRVAVAQQRAIYSANEELLRMYWDLGRLLHKFQKSEGWGKGTLKRLSADMKNEYPKQKGFSERNFQFMIQFFEEYNQELTMVNPIAQKHVAQLEAPNTKLSISQLNTSITK